jgi:hypothetical protein
MKKSIFLMSVLFYLGVIMSTLFAQDIEAKLGDNTESVGFYVKNSNDDALFIVRGDGNVGIGTSTPNLKLLVNGRVAFLDRLNIETTNERAIQILDKSTSLSRNLFSIMNMYGQCVSAGANPYMTFQTADQNLVTLGALTESGAQSPPSSFILKVNAGGGLIERMRVTSSGNIGIGTTSPASPSGFTRFVNIEGTDDAALELSASNCADNKWTVGMISSSFDIRNNNDAKIRVLNNGDVGIGTTSPSQKLDVAGTVRMTGFQMPTGASNGYVLTSDGSGVGTWQALSGTADGDWTISGSDMYSGVSGNVGVGTTSPGAKLEVNGSSLFGGNIRINGSVGLNADPLTSSHNTLYLYDGYGLSEPRIEVSGGNQSSLILEARRDDVTDGNRWVIQSGGGTETYLDQFVIGIEGEGGSFYIRDGGKVGIGEKWVKNRLDVEGAMAVGATYSGTNTAPTNGMIIEGNVGIATASPNSTLDVNGTAEMTGFKLTTSPASGYVLTSDAAGVGTWQAVPTGSSWHLTGNSGTTPGTHFVGTTDNNALQLHVNGTRAFRIEPDATCPNIVGGCSANSVSTGVYGATIGGGGQSSHINLVTDEYGTISGGYKNRAGDDSGTISDQYGATVGGGIWNIASGALSTIAGGNLNKSTGFYATVGGGAGNIASGLGATVPGGYANIALGSYSFAGGWRANASNDGCFVWADAQDVVFSSTGDNQFIIRAQGGVGIGTNSPHEQLEVSGVIRVTGLSSASAGTDVNIDANGNLYKVSSSERYKKDIRPTSFNRDDVLKLRPVQFKWKSTNESDIGLIAEEVEQLIPNLVARNKAGEPESVKYSQLSVYLLDVIKQQQQEIDALQHELKFIKQKLERF